MKELERALKALANRRRLLIAALLKKKTEVAVGDIAEGIELSFRATSKHLRILFSADILDRRQRSSGVYYSLSASLPPVAKGILKHL